MEFELFYLYVMFGLLLIEIVFFDKFVFGFNKVDVVVVVE